jgi:hypothetical protein
MPDSTVRVLPPFSGYGTTQSLDYPFPSFIQRGPRMAMVEIHQSLFKFGEMEPRFATSSHIDDVVLREPSKACEIRY